jgi:endoglucanase
LGPARGNDVDRHPARTSERKDGFVYRRLVIAFGVVVIAAIGRLHASDLRGVYPITDRILCLHMDDGHIDYKGVDAQTGAYEQNRNLNKVYIDSLDIARARQVQTYGISSSDDPAYHQGMAVAYVGHKAKGAEFNSQWPRSGDPEFIREHWLYLALPSPLVENKTYTLAMDSLAWNYDSVTFTFDSRTRRSLSVHVNQVGFVPQSPKHAWLSHWAGDYFHGGIDSGAIDFSAYQNASWHLVDSQTGDVAKTYSGITLQKPRTEQDNNSLGNWTRADVWMLDFSDFTTPGSYYIAVDGLGCSLPFEIRDDIYREAYRVVARGMYFSRQGIVKRVDEYGNRLYPRSHHPDDGIEYRYYPHQTAKGPALQQPDTTSYPVTGIWGHYFDAGDWDYYHGHFRVPLVLMALFDLKPENFADGDVGNVYKHSESDAGWIEEGANGHPDILDEAQWMLDFGRRTIDALQDAGLGTGGMPVYAGVDAGVNNAGASWWDRRTNHVKAESPLATYFYAGCAAYYAYCLDKLPGGTHPDSDTWRQEALDAYAWAKSNDTLPADTSKAAIDAHESRIVANLGLYLLTGQDSYQQAFKASWANLRGRKYGSWVSVHVNVFAALIYGISCADKPNLDATVHGEITDLALRQAKRILADTEGFLYGGVESWQSVNMYLFTAPRTIWMAIAHELTGDPVYIESMHTTLAYLMGGNPMDRVTISGLGDRPDPAPFYPDGWVLLDFNSMAYKNPPLPGYAAPGRLAPYDVHGDGSEKWSRSTVLPALDSWPEAELRIDNRNSISGSELTIHQSHPWWYFATGYLIDPGGKTLVNDPPSVAIGLQEGQALGAEGTITLTAAASSDTRIVEYYADWHYLGSSREAETDFRLQWPSKLHAGDTVVFTAIAIDGKGRRSLPAPEGEARVLMTSQATPAHLPNIAESAPSSIRFHETQQGGVAVRFRGFGRGAFSVRLYTPAGKLLTERTVLSKSAEASLRFSRSEVGAPGFMIAALTVPGGTTVIRRTMLRF